MIQRANRCGTFSPVLIIQSEISVLVSKTSTTKLKLFTSFLTWSINVLNWLHYSLRNWTYRNIEMISWHMALLFSTSVLKIAKAMTTRSIWVEQSNTIWMGIIKLHYTTPTHIHTRNCWWCLAREILRFYFHKMACGYFLWWIYTNFRWNRENKGRDKLLPNHIYTKQCKTDAIIN